MTPIVVVVTFLVLFLMICVSTNLGWMVGAVNVDPNNNDNINHHINHDLHDDDDDHHENVFVQQQQEDAIFPQSLLVRKKQQQKTTMNDHLSIWPFPNHHNTTNNNNTDDNHGNNSTNNNNTNDKVCFDASSSCERCNSYYTCHYCAHTNTCHAIGSIYGCMIGSTCASVHPKPPKPKPNPNNIDPNDTASGCSMYTTCHNCTTSSSLCHWCAHDNRCHVLGSVYGCITGVDCYDNNHCQRLLPERIIPKWNNNNNDTTNHHQNHTAMNSTDMNHTIGTLPLIIIVSISTILFCCTTFCCCIMNCIKGAYDDLAYTTSNNTTGTNPILNDADDDDAAYLFIENEDSINSNNQNDANASANRSSSECNRNEPIVISNERDEEEQEAVEDGLASSDEQDVGTSNASEQEPLLAQTTTTTTTPITVEETTGGTITDEYIQMVDGEDGTSLLPNPNCRRNTSTNATRSGSHVRRRRQQRGLLPTRRRFTAMNRLYTTCMVCYTCNLLLIGIGTYLSITYFPQKPIYNICNDSVAWKSLMDSMTSFTATAEFEILASIYNPNVFDIALDVGKGNFAHDNTIVGTYEIPPTLIASQAITDILIVAKFTPEKWQALSITAEYYHGTLVMSVNADATIRIPFLFDYTISTSLQDITVHVNELSDRHLCSCPYNTK